MSKPILLALLVVSLFLAPGGVKAQTPTPTAGPVYIVQAGDTLSSIAVRFNISLNDIMTSNDISDPNTLAVGQQLVIPGLPGITGVLDTEVINFGDSYRSLLRRTQLPEELVRKLNHLISPTQLYVGSNVVISRQDSQVPDLTNRIGLTAGQSLLELAVGQNTDPWTLSGMNELAGTWDALPGDVLYAPGSGTGQAAGGLPSAFLDVQIPTLPFKQGNTEEILVKTAPGVTLGGMLVDRPLHFFPMDDGRQVALQGIYVLLDPGVYPLELDATLPDGTQQSYEQMVLVNAGNYPKESLTVPSEFVDPAVTAPEDKYVAALTAPATPDKYWQGAFKLPVALPFCIKDWFGIRRSFNGSDYNYFHSGVDYGICSPDHPFDIYAAAPGKVIFAGPLNVRGNATFIDHGWGVYTGYFHQAEIDVSVGQQVETGQLIGKIGDSGRVTGPHLHLDLWVNGVQVNPLDWFNQTFP